MVEVEEKNHDESEDGITENTSHSLFYQPNVTIYASSNTSGSHSGRWRCGGFSRTKLSTAIES
jgi:hypothetical protein